MWEKSGHTAFSSISSALAVAVPHVDVCRYDLGKWQAALSTLQPARVPSNQDTYTISFTQSALPSRLYSLPDQWLKHHLPFCRTEIRAERQALTSEAIKGTEQLNLNKGFSQCPCPWRTHHYPKWWQGRSCMICKPPGTGNDSPSSCQGSLWDGKAVSDVSSSAPLLALKKPYSHCKVSPKPVVAVIMAEYTCCCMGAGGAADPPETLWSQCHSPKLKIHLYNHQHGDYGWWCRILHAGGPMKNFLTWIW